MNKGTMSEKPFDRNNIQGLTHKPKMRQSPLSMMAENARAQHRAGNTTVFPAIAYPIHRKANGSACVIDASGNQFTIGEVCKAANATKQQLEVTHGTVGTWQSAAEAFRHSSEALNRKNGDLLDALFDWKIASLVLLVGWIATVVWVNH